MAHSKGDLKQEVVEALKGVGCCDYRFNLEQLGLISDVQVTGDGEVSVEVLPCCIFGMTRLVKSVEEGLAQVDGLNKVAVAVAWDQLGERSSMPTAALGNLQLNLESLAKEHGLKGWGDRTSPPV
jgi:metal-sulfur cluster biosynthetic enzyme